MTPLKDVVLIKADPPEKKIGMLYVEESWKTLPLTGKILAVGPLVTSVKAGQRVGFNRYASIILPEDERLVKENQIIWLES